MDIILTPTKLKGSIDARPWSVSSHLHSAAQHLAKAAGASAGPDASAADGRTAGMRSETAPTPGASLPESLSEDLEATLRCLRALTGGEPMLDCGKSVLTLTLLYPIAAALREKVAFVGDPEINWESILPLFDVLRQHGTDHSRGSLKIRRRNRKRIREICILSGRLKYGHFSLTGKEDPWFTAGLLMALPLLEGNSSLRTTTMPQINEIPIMAVDILHQYGIAVRSTVDDYGYPSYEIAGSQSLHAPENIRVEGDWGQAAFWLCCGALGGNVTVRGLRADSPQVSRQILDKLHTMGAGTGLGEGSANVTAARLTGCNINAGRIPDLVPILAVAMASASGASMLTDMNRPDLESIQRALILLGGDVLLEEDKLDFRGKPVLTGGEVDPLGNPAAVLTAAGASCICAEPVLIRNAGIINKYYPDFFRDFTALGGRIRVL